MDPTLLVIQDAIAAIGSLKNPQGKTIKDNFTSMTNILYSKKPNSDEPTSEALTILNEIIQTNFFLTVINRFPYLQVDLRKQLTLIFSAAINIQQGRSYPLVIWINNNISILDLLLNYYSKETLSINSGEMLRICAHHASLASQLLLPERLEKLTSYFDVTEFDISSDSFTTFKELLLNSPISQEWIPHHYQYVVDTLHGTINEINYASTIQSLKLIGDLLLMFEFFRDKYLNDEKCLAKIMQTMSSQYHGISIEAYHIFKLFVANDPKTEIIIKILKQNGRMLIDFIKEILPDTEDEHLLQERDYVIMTLKLL